MIVEALFTGTGFEEAAFAAARIATGTFFAISGYHKLFNKARHQTLVQTLKSTHVPAIWFNQWWVPGVEFSAGLAVAFGLLAPLAALGLIVICLVATLTDGIQRVRGWSPIDRADAVDDVLYLPEVLYLLLLTTVLTGGAGRFSLDALIATFL